MGTAREFELTLLVDAIINGGAVKWVVSGEKVDGQRRSAPEARRRIAE